MWRRSISLISPFSNTLNSTLLQISNYFLRLPLQSPKNNHFSIYTVPQMVLDQNPNFWLIYRDFRNFRTFTSVPETVSSTDVDEVEEIQENPQKLEKDEAVDSTKKLQTSTRKRNYGYNQHNRPKGMTQGKFAMLRRRQVKVETEAWEQAAKEYQELLTDMCERKLAPNLPYVKTLFLGWFEPFRDAILKEQELCSDPRNKTYGQYIVKLPADKLAVITMHKLMALLMSGGSDGSVTVVKASCLVGEAIEHEIRIHKFLEKTKKSVKEKNGKDKEKTTKERDILHTKVSDLMKKQKLKLVRKIVKGQDESRPWGVEIQAKVGSRMIELLIDKAFIQPPINQGAEGPVDIRPAFRHTHKNIHNEKQTHSKRYGVIVCDPSIRRGLDKTAKYMVVPYMPMVAPPVNWSGNITCPSCLLMTALSKRA